MRKKHPRLERFKSRRAREHGNLLNRPDARPIPFEPYNDHYIPMKAEVCGDGISTGVNGQPSLLSTFSAETAQNLDRARYSWAMALVPFVLRFPELGFSETRSVTIEKNGPKHTNDGLPEDSYGFCELYCDDPDCDCRRVLIQVLSKKRGDIVATISHAFEPPPPGELITEQTFLDPLNIQTKYSPGLLELFQLQVLPSPDYQDRLVRHYRMFRDSIASGNAPSPDREWVAHRAELILNKSVVLKEYDRLRKAGIQLNKELNDFIDREELFRGGAELGILEGNKLALNTEDELCVVFDHVFHTQRQDEKTVYDRMLLEKPPVAGSDEDRYLRANQNCALSLIRVTDTVPGFGVECVIEGSDEPVFIVDRGFSKTAHAGLNMLTRLIAPASGWWMTTGAALPVSEAVHGKISSALNKYVKVHGRQPGESEFATLCTRLCLEAGASEQIAYATPEQSGRTPQLQRGAKVGRNDLCPCGSGKKYKKCCGK